MTPTGIVFAHRATRWRVSPLLPIPAACHASGPWIDSEEVRTARLSFAPEDVVHQAPPDTGLEPVGQTALPLVPPG